MRLAAIDIGTNSIHMLVAQITGSGTIDVIDREKDMARLGAGGLDARALSDAAMAAGLAALGKFKRLAEAHDVDDIVAVATSATREATNGGEFLSRIAAETGIRARVISGTEEARLIHRAAMHAVHPREGATVIDIGGGSVEITSGPASHATHARSFKLGALRLAERFGRTDPIGPRDERRLVRHIEQEVGDYLHQIGALAARRVIGTSGTILALGALALDESGHAPDDLRNQRVSARALHRVRKRLVALDLHERLACRGMDPRRADIIVCGAVLLDTLLHLLKASDITLCTDALREGLVLDYAQRHRRQIARAARWPDPRQRSVRALAERALGDTRHTQHVVTLSLSLFDQLHAAHGLGMREREWLESAAWLHDVGMVVAHEGHHKHSYYVIRHAPLHGFAPEERDRVALIARAHRSGKPKKTLDEYRRLDADGRRAVRWLSAMLAVAEALDRSHAGVVARIEVLVGQAPDPLVLRLWTTTDAALEHWAAQRHVEPLTRQLERPVRFEVVSVHAGAALPSPTTIETAPASPEKKRRRAAR